jgi:hypothetical protein
MDKVILSNYTAEQLSAIISEAVDLAVRMIQEEGANQPKGESYLSRKETSEKLKISLVTLNDWTKRGILKSYIIGGRVLYKNNEVEASLGEVKTVKY